MSCKEARSILKGADQDLKTARKKIKMLRQMRWNQSLFPEVRQRETD
jgi:hypothetical protein